MTSTRDLSDVTVGVVGAGTMGAGIAQVAASSGHRTLLLDVRPGAAAAAVEQVLDRLRRAAAKGRTTAQQVDAVADRLQAVSSVADLSGCGLVVEAVVEDLAVKHDLLLRLEAAVAPEAVLASNTSSLSVTDLAAPLARPGRVAGLHFFNPAPLMRLVEVVHGERTDAAVVDALTDLAQRWGKVPVSCTSTPGFVVNRVARPFYGEAFRLLADHGAEAPGGGPGPGTLTAATVDALLREAGGFPMGPLELTDLIGQDVNAAVNRGVWQATGRDPRYAPSPVQDALVAAGDLGRKSGRGFYPHGAAGAARRDGTPAPGPATVQPSDAAHPPLRFGPGLSTLLARAAGSDATAPHVDLADAMAPSGHSGSDAAAPSDATDGVVVMRTDGRTAAQVEAATGRPTVLLDAIRDQATCTRVGATVSPGCPYGSLEVLAAALVSAGVAVSPLPDTPGLVVARTAAALVNAGHDAVEAEVATAGDVDLAMQHGAGYPQGPLAWGRTLDEGWVVGVLDALHVTEPTGRYRVSPTLRSRAMLARDRVSAGFGIGLVSAGDGRGVVRTTVTEAMLNGFGIVHGGVVCLVADTALAVACNSHGLLTVGAGLDVSWLSAGRLGDVLTATAVERARYGGGRRNGLYDVTITRDDGTVVAEVRGRTRTVGRPAAPAPASPKEQS